MRPTYTPLKKLTDKSKGFKLKVKVVHKGSPTQSPSKRRFQKLVFKDEEGNTMRGTLFERDIDTYEQALKRNGEYELSDVTIKPLEPQYRSKPDEEYHIGLGGQMRIRALDLSECSDEPQYRHLGHVPTSYSSDTSLLDLAVVVLYVGNVLEEKHTGYVQTTREIILADQSVSRPLKLTAKNKFAHDDAAEFITHWHEGFQIIGFTGIRVVTYRGLALTTTLSSTYVAAPKGDVPTATADWMVDHLVLLEAWRQKARSIYSNTHSKDTTKIAKISEKKANVIWQDEFYWTLVSLPNLQVQDIYFYYGCEHCGKRASGHPGSKEYCYACGKKDATIEARIVLNTDIVDSSGSLRITAYTAAAEIFLNCRADEVSVLKKQDSATIDKRLAEPRRNLFLVKICPNHELSTSNVLKWIVTAVEVASIEDDATPLQQIGQAHDHMLLDVQPITSVIERQNEAAIYQDKGKGIVVEDLILDKGRQIEGTPSGPTPGSCFERTDQEKGCSFGPD